MRIFTWNVNGVRACHRKGEFLKFLADQAPDVLCLQETKAEPDQLPAELLSEHGYHVVWASAEKKGYSGTATFSKVPPAAIETGIGEARFDSEGRTIITRHGDITVVNGYFPHGQRDHARLPFKTDYYRAMLALGQRLRAEGGAVVLCGDWNTAHTELDIKNAKENRKTSGFTDAERALVDEFIAAGYVDAFRALHPDTRDVYSWWSSRFGVRERNVGWRIDYHLVAEEAFPRVSAARVHTKVLGSDHCPVELEIA
ncbi:MAG: exodeoxyribonuclease III [Myxococcales bacterium]|nr:exodeoxyribonuclease III [Myxococcales bacterium]